MGLKKVKGNMYSFITHTWNPVRGQCCHDCTYCYMKRWGKQRGTNLDEIEFSANLGTNNYIFVCSGTDLFTDYIPAQWVMKVFIHCFQRLENRYLFQSKNPKRIYYFMQAIPEIKVKVKDNITFCTTIESNRDYAVSQAPPVGLRAMWLRKIGELGFKTMVTIEPVMDFDLDEMITLIESAGPMQVNLGADSQKSGLMEPDFKKVEQLIYGLSKFTKVHLKQNLFRLKDGR